MHFPNEFDSVPKMAHKIPSFFLILFSAFLMILSNSVKASSQLKEEIEKCNRLPHWKVAKKYKKYSFFVGNSASAFIDLNFANLKDFLMNQALYRIAVIDEESIFCPRIFLNMKKLEDNAFGSSIYKGSLVVGHEGIFYEGLKKPIVTYNSGDTAEDNQFNTWQGDWQAPDVNFAAIFESPNHSAVILHITKVEKEDRVDGKPTYKGHGEVWFKMFRLFWDREDVCYTQAPYTSTSNFPPPAPRKKCWFLDIGPYSCLPQGIRTIESFDLRGPRPCYKKLGEFRDLDIRKAFNLSAEEDHP